ncbi:MAG TPA: hypothetical protein VNQ77_20300 [Frankiaceae bacterium]|nr:hypothetical protein [Frankiaceae bacterium]
MFHDIHSAPCVSSVADRRTATGTLTTGRPRTDLARGELARDDALDARGDDATRSAVARNEDFGTIRDRRRRDVVEPERGRRRYGTRHPHLGDRRPERALRRHGTRRHDEGVPTVWDDAAEIGLANGAVPGQVTLGATYDAVLARRDLPPPFHGPSLTAATSPQRS